METTKGFFKSNRQLETKDYSYKTGASYSGQWNGGLRHGKGTMIWTDQARYTGQWQYNQACG